MTNYYKVRFQEEDRLGVGHTVEKRDLFFLPDSGKVDRWQPLVLELRDGDYPDYLASNLGCRLCSERLKGILHSRASPADVLEWLEVVVRKYDQDRRYFILHFPQPPDVLN